jgi:hypothetical protein
VFPELQYWDVHHLGVHSQSDLPLVCLLGFSLSQSAAYSGGRAANFAVFTFIKRELTVNTLRKVKSVKTTMSNTRFVQITKSNQDLL